MRYVEATQVICGTILMLIDLLNLHELLNASAHLGKWLSMVSILTQKYLGFKILLQCNLVSDKCCVPTTGVRISQIPD